MAGPLIEVGAVVKLPTGRFAEVVDWQGDEVDLHLVDLNRVERVDDGLFFMSVYAVARCPLAWHADQWRKRGSEFRRADWKRKTTKGF
jgi:hypothetical protein